MGRTNVSKCPNHVVKSFRFQDGSVIESCDHCSYGNGRRGRVLNSGSVKSLKSLPVDGPTLSEKIERLHDGEPEALSVSNWLKSVTPEPVERQDEIDFLAINEEFEEASREDEYRELEETLDAE